MTKISPPTNNWE